MYCPNCGASNLDAGKFCMKCGAALATSVIGTSGSDRPAIAASAVAEPSSSAPSSIIYAGFWRRVWAYLVDYVIMLVFGFVLGLGAALSAPSMLNEGDQRLTLFVLLVVWLYTAMMESSSYQATLGKLALGIKVTDLSGRRVTFWRATGRFLAEILNSLTLGIGYLIAAFTRRRQALHDLVAATLVVDKRIGSAAIVDAGPARPMSGWAAAGIVLVALVPVAGMLAAIAIPAYQDYTIRAQVAEGLKLATQHKSAITSAWNSNTSALEDIDTARAGQRLATSGKYVDSMEIESGAVIITYGNSSHMQIQGRVLTLVPAISETRSITWACGYGDAPPGYEVMFENHGQYTNVPAEFLPQACR